MGIPPSNVLHQYARRLFAKLSKVARPISCTMLQKLRKGMGAAATSHVAYVPLVPTHLANHESEYFAISGSPVGSGPRLEWCNGATWLGKGHCAATHRHIKLGCGGLAVWGKTQRGRAWSGTLGRTIDKPKQAVVRAPLGVAAKAEQTMPPKIFIIFDLW